MRRILAQARKELIQIVRDRRTLALALVLPAILLMLLSAGLSLRVSNLPVVVQDFDDSPASRGIRRRVPRVDRVPRCGVARRSTARRRPVGERRARRLDHSRPLRAGHRPRSRHLGPASGRRLRCEHGQAHRRLCGANHAGLQSAERPVSSVRGPCRRRSVSGTIPGSPPRSSTARESSCWRCPCSRRCWRLWPWPGRRAEDDPPGVRLQHLGPRVPAGKDRRLRDGGAGGVPDHAVLLFTYFGLGFVGDPSPFVVATILYAFCVAAFGTMVGAAIPSQVAAMQAVALGGFLLVFLLSGLIFPIENIPAGLRWISTFIWGRYYIEVVRDAFLQGGGWPAVWWKVADHRAHRGDVLCHRLVGHAPDAALGMRMPTLARLRSQSPSPRADRQGIRPDPARSPPRHFVDLATGPAAHAFRIRPERVGGEPAPGRR